MKAIALSGSRRKTGNTWHLIRPIFEALEESGIETEIIRLGNYRIDGCTGCEGCSGSWDCIIEDDYQSIIEKIDAADLVILASPTYWYSVTSDMKRFIDRSYSLVQYPESRQKWVGRYSGSGKLCVTLAVCEQPDEEMMGNTLELLTDFASDIGLDVRDSIAATGYFEAGSVTADRELISRVRQSGEKLADLLSG